MTTRRPAVAGGPLLCPFTAVFLAGVLLFFAARPLAAQTVLHLAFDGSDEPLIAADGVGPLRPAAREAEYRRDVPGKYIYDPLTGRSRRNRQSRFFAEGAGKPAALGLEVDFTRAGLSGQAITLEAFVKPGPGAGGDAWLAGKSRAGEQAAELALEWHELRNHNQTWHGARAAVPGGPAERFPVGHYLSSTRLSEEYKGWRHVAVVYDPAERTVTCWLDYHLARSIQVAAPLAWDNGPLWIGGRGEEGGLAGQVDEVRLTRGALGPPDFLRARETPLKNVSFHSRQEIVPRDSGCYDLKEHFGAAGDGQTDDTAAFNTAFAHLADKVPLAYNTLVIPPGEYLVSGMLYCSRFIDVKGAGPERTVIRLKDATFPDPARPQPVLRMSSTRGDPGSHDAVNGSSISLYLEGLTIDTGRGNAGAKALEYHSNNLGRLENVVLRSGDGAGVLGLDLTHHDVGPALVKHVRIEGFDLGAAIRYQEYSLTLEHVSLRGQRVAGLRNQGNILAVRGLHSQNAVPAIVSEGANSMLTLLDSVLEGGAADQPAIRSEGGLYCLRVRTAGYGRAIAKRVLESQQPETWTETAVAGPQLDEYVGDNVVSGHGTGRAALKLPVEETPSPPLPPLNEWVNVASFAAHKQGDDWAPAVQAAIESGARLLYFPRQSEFTFHSPIRLRGRVERLLGFGGELHWAPAAWQGDGGREQTDEAAAPPPLLVFDDPDPERVVVLDRLGCVHVRHASPGTLVLRSSTPGRYTTGMAGGRLFAEDVGGADWHFDHPQHAWVRQWNPESHQAGPCIHSRGATLWVLGFKTEYESQKLLAEGGAQTELLGAFIYPLGEIPADRPIFENRDSALSLVYGTSVYRANHQVHIRDEKAGAAKEIGNDALRWAGSRARMDLYTSDAR